MDAKQIDDDLSEGTTLDAAFRAANIFGICSLEKWQYHPGQFYAGPSLEAIDEALLYRVERFLQVDRNELIKYLKMLICEEYLSSPRAIAVGVPVYDTSWSSYITEQDGKVFDPLPDSLFLGGHAILLVGYRDDENAPGGGYFEFRNSWGTEWASSTRFTPPGYGIISYAYIENYVWETMTVVAMKDIEKSIPASLFSFGESLTNGNKSYLSKKGEENHAIIIGKTGSGKTSSTKSLIIQNVSGIDYYIFDVHDDYTDETFLEKTNADVWDILEDGLPFNVFQPPYDGAKVSNIPVPLHIQSIRNSIKVCFPSMGSRQLSLISEALELLYSNNGNNIQRSSFSDLKYYLLLTANGKREKIRIAESIIDNLRPVFSMKLLDVNKNVTAQALMSQQGNMVFRCKLPDQSDEIKKLVAVFLISGLFSSLKYTGKSNCKPKIFVADEFHLLKGHPVWERIIREGRKFNVGLWAISQKIEDVEHLIPNVKHMLIFQAFGSVQKQRIVRQVAQTVNKHNNILHEIEFLRQFEALYMNSGGNYRKICISPYFQFEESKIRETEMI